MLDHCNCPKWAAARHTGSKAKLDLPKSARVPKFESGNKDNACLMANTEFLHSKVPAFHCQRALHKAC